MIVHNRKKHLSKNLGNLKAKLKTLLNWFSLVMITTNIVLIGMVFVFGRNKLQIYLSEISASIREEISTNYYQFKTPKVEHLNIDIKFEDWQKIETKRKEALDLGLLLASDEDYVKGQLRFDNQTMPIKLRLKGDWTDHLVGDKWSFRIHVKGENSFKGMKYFSIQDPKTRSMANEWLFYKVLKKEDLISLRYDFIDVSINGDSKGIFAIEEHFSKELIENNKRREGPIIKFSEDRVWENNLRYEFAEGSETGQSYVSPIEPFKANKTQADDQLHQQFLEAKRLLENYRQGETSVDDVFDIKSWAKVYALADLFNVRHGLTTHNIRLYYNPITGLIEPVIFDAMIEKRIVKLSISSESIMSEFPGMFSSIEFQKHYISYLNKYSQSEYLDTLLKNIKPDLDYVEKILKRDQLYDFAPTFFYMNQAFIRKKLTDVPAIRAEINHAGVVEIQSLTELPVEILSVNNDQNNSIADYSDTPVFIPGSSKEKASSGIPLTTINPIEPLETIQVSYRFLGLDEVYKVPLNRWLINLDDQRFTTQQTSLPHPVQFDQASKTYSVPAGSWQFKRDIVIPKNSKLVVGPNTQIDLVNSAAIISHSPVFIEGDRGKPIRIHSSDKTGAGLLVLNADDKSKIDHTLFEDLSHIKSKSNNITGSVSFYQSPVEITHSIFDKNHAEDMLNIVRSSFWVINSSFTKSFSDAVDLDFSTGEIKDTTFRELGNDGLDTSGSKVIATNLVIDQAGDKAVSVGEASQVEIKDSQIKNSKICYASKDGSTLTVQLGRVDNCKIGYTVYQKKPEYGPGELIIWNTQFSGLEREWLIEENSVIRYNGNDYHQGEKDVYKEVTDL